MYRSTTLTLRYVQCCRHLLTFTLVLISTLVHAQTFSIENESDSLNHLVLRTDSTTSRWRLPYPVYRFQTGDVDGDGKEDALVGVMKATRFYKEKGRRLFIFKNKDGMVRPLWMGSKLGGILEDFRFTDGKVLSLERTTCDTYVVAEYQWQGFGMGFCRFLFTGTKEDAEKIFHTNN